MARTQVVEIETSIKGGGIARLGPRTIIIGKSRAGKSTIVNGIEAAGSGRVSDVAGRATLAKDAELSTLGSGSSIYARALLSDGVEASWYLEKGHRAKRTGPEIAFPLREVREAILGEPDKARKWILRNGGDVSWDDVKELVPEALQKKLAALPRDEVEGGADAAGQLAAAIDEAKRRQREANARSKNRPAAPAGPPPTDAEVKAAEDRVRSFDNAGALTKLAAIRAKVAKLTADVGAAEKVEAEALKDLAALPATPPLSEFQKAALVLVEALAANHAKTCVLCGGAPAAGTFEKRAEHARKMVKDTIEAEKLRAQLAAVVHKAHCDVTDLKPALAAVLAEEKTLAEVTGGGTPPEGDPDIARRALRGLHERRAAWRLVRDAETEALQAEADALAWGQLAEALSGALGKLVERARGAFERKVQAFLPESWVFGVDLLDGEREVLRVGLRDMTPEDVEMASAVGADPGGLRSALSGVEWATVTMALALATAPEDGPVVVAPEERAFDPDTLAEVLAAIAEAPVQVVMTSPIEPSRIPEGWTVVRVGPQPTVPVADGWLPVKADEEKREEAAAVAAPPPQPQKKRANGAGPGRPPKNRPAAPKPDPKPAEDDVTDLADAFS